MYEKLVVIFCVVVMTTGSSMSADFQTCSLQCSNENDQFNPSPRDYSGSLNMIPGKPGPRGSKGERGYQGAKGEPGVEWNKDRVIQLEEQLVNLTAELAEIKSKLASLEKRTNGSVEELTTDTPPPPPPPSYRLRLTPRAGSFDEVQQMCVELGGELVQQTLAQDVGGRSYRDTIWRLSEGHDLWIGITDRYTEGVWGYLNNKPFADTTSLVVRWNSGEPNNGANNYAGEGPEHCALVFHHSGSLLMDDRPCTYGFYGICEIQN